jgi:hypothetical protein
MLSAIGDLVQQTAPKLVRSQRKLNLLQFCRKEDLNQNLRRFNLVATTSAMVGIFSAGVRLVNGYVIKPLYFLFLKHFS